MKASQEGDSRQHGQLFLVPQLQQSIRSYIFWKTHILTLANHVHVSTNSFIKDDICFCVQFMFLFEEKQIILCRCLTVLIRSKKYIKLGSLFVTHWYYVWNILKGKSWVLCWLERKEEKGLERSPVMEAVHIMTSEWGRKPNMEISWHENCLLKGLFTIFLSIVQISYFG